MTNETHSDNFDNKWNEASEANKKSKDNIYPLYLNIDRSSFFQYHIFTFPHKDELLVIFTSLICLAIKNVV